MSSDIFVKDGTVYGGWRQPINVWANLPGSIHNDEVASKIGMRGGTIPGTVHFNLFGPLFFKMWGKKWWEQGTISMYYTYATKHKEDVRAAMKIPEKDALNFTTDAWVETPDGHIVCKGTISIGKTDEGYVRSLELRSSGPGECRILADLYVGAELDPKEKAVVTREQQDKGLQTITDNMDWYNGSYPDGGAFYLRQVYSSCCQEGYPRGLSSSHR